MTSKLANNFVELSADAIRQGLELGLGHDDVSVKKQLYYAYNMAEPVNHINGTMKFRNVILDVQDSMIQGVVLA